MTFTENPEFESWLNELALMPSTPIAENFYADTPIGGLVFEHQLDEFMLSTR